MSSIVIKTSDNKEIEIDEVQFKEFTAYYDACNFFEKDEKEIIELKYSEKQINRFLNFIKIGDYEEILKGQLKERTKECLKKKQFDEMRKNTNLLEFIKSTKISKMDESAITILSLIVNDLDLVEFLCNDKFIQILIKFYLKVFDVASIQFDSFFSENKNFFPNKDIEHLLIGEKKKVGWDFYLHYFNGQKQIYYKEGWYSPAIKLELDNGKERIYADDIVYVHLNSCWPLCCMVEDKNKNFHLFNSSFELVKKDFLQNVVRKSFHNFYYICRGIYTVQKEDGTTEDIEISFRERKKTENFSFQIKTKHIISLN